jgi:hypothetical protein
MALRGGRFCEDLTAEFIAEERIWERRLDVRADQIRKSIGAENAFTSDLSAFEVEDFHRAAISPSGQVNGGPWLRSGNYPLG